ncbi:lipase 3-like [Belonocnema kinseyi]|uniref:lipase 3-like n=1 Tax=Belonocnema kinseyi TaxID=2817044 RepID=UPI00143CEDFC|nr:lipase 3-like [Belonocnema kinseyi]
MRKLPTLRGFVCYILFLFFALQPHRGLAATIFRDQDGEELLPEKQTTGNHLQTFMDLVGASGYTAEEHDVTTQDGYILSIHRIPGGPKSPVTPGKPAVVLIHGLFAASDIWVLRGPGKDLAYLLCDEGYDVWFLNIRGNFYGKRHKRLSTKDSKFWRFSWHEFGIYDAPATIDYVLKITGLGKVSLIGHSMGATIELVLFSMKPEYNDKVNVAISFAPVAIFTHLLPGLFGNLGIRYGKQLQKTFQLLGMNEILPRNTASIEIYSSLCEGPRIEYFCRKFMFNLVGLTNAEQFDTSMIPMMLQHYPQGTSLETLLHFRQNILSGKFRQYDFGPGRNLVRYKNVNPPEYNLTKVTVPAVLFYGSNDAYTTEKDVMALRARLPNAITREVPFEKFSHLDFLFSNYSKILVYDDVISVLSKYNIDERINETQP